MPMLFALLLASVTLSPPFGQAEARAVDVRDDGMTLEVEVEVQQSALVVLVRGVGPVDELPPVAMSELTPGRWGGIVELPVVENIQLGFEVIRPDGGSAEVSELSSLIELGVDPAIFELDIAPATTEGVSGPTAETSASAERSDSDPSVAPIWLAVATGAAALALVLVWSLGGRKDDDAHQAGETVPDPVDDGDRVE